MSGYDDLRTAAQSPVSRLLARLSRPTHALPVDIFRVLVGLLSCAYFLHLLVQARDFSGPDGLIDHELVLELFWYMRIGLFQPGMGLTFFQAAFLAAAVASWALVIGYRVKLISAFLFLIAVSTYRWNYLVTYVDDAIMHLVLFWMLLLPVGRTLVVQEWVRDRRGAIERWKGQLVPGLTVHCFLANLALIYLVAGLWKWTSPMWREGTALYVILQMPIAFAPDFWGPQHLPLLRIASYLALIVEPLLALAIVLPTNHWLKWVLLAALFGFHGGIIAMLKIPYANVACIAAAVLIARDEIMLRLRRPVGSGARRGPARLDLAGKASLAFVTVLTLAMLAEATVPPWRFSSRLAEDVGRTNEHLRAIAHDGGRQEWRAGFHDTGRNPLYVPLWAVGIAQSYRLFDWVDNRNFTGHYEVKEHRGDGATHAVDPRELFPTSLRGTLLQAYLHDITWARVPPSRSDELKLALYGRFASRFCGQHPSRGLVEVHATIWQITLEEADRRRGERELLMQFECRGEEASLSYVKLPSSTPTARAASPPQSTAELR